MDRRDALPPYRHQPGVTPHPTRDPAGHSFGQGDPFPLEAFDAARARGDARFERGIRLFDEGYHWEAHEVWEGAWRATPRERAEWAFLKGLIQLAAAFVHRRAGKASAGRIGERGMRHLADAAGGAGSYASVDVTALIDAVRAALDDPRVLAPRIPRA